MLIKFFHHLLNPHCEKCDTCKSCEVLKYQNEILIKEKNDLLLAVLGIVKPVVIPTSNVVENRNPVGVIRNWDSQKKILEEQDRINSRIKAEQAERFKDSGLVNKLEEELGIKDDSIQSK